MAHIESSDERGQRQRCISEYQRQLNKRHHPARRSRWNANRAGSGEITDESFSFHRIERLGDAPVLTLSAHHSSIKLTTSARTPVARRALRPDFLVTDNWST